MKQPSLRRGRDWGFRASGSPRRIDLRLGEESQASAEMEHFWPFSPGIFQPKPKQTWNQSQNRFEPTKNTFIVRVRVFPTLNIDKERVRIVS